jgi:Tfp pilus assembly protein PilN
MRAVNLIPPEERRGEHAPSRTGPLAYIVVGVLVLALLAVTAVVVTKNKIADRKSEVASLKVQQAEVNAQAVHLQAYADFASLQAERTQTVTSLAQSRFDWDRVLRELALVIPNDVWLTSLDGTVSSEVTTGTAGASQSSSASDLRGQIPGPALAMTGCAASHTAVAGFLTAVKEIDGVTRVAISDSSRPTDGGSAAASGPAGNSACSGGDIARFNLVAAFDAVQIDPATQAPAAPAAPSAAPGADQSGIADAQQQEAAGRQSVQQQSDKAHQAVSTLLPGTVSR